jgi:methyl-accepting chemotaxis protein
MIRFVSLLFASLGFKLLSLFAALGVTIVMIVSLGLSAIESTSASVQELVETDLPNMVRSNDVLTKLIVVAEAFAEVLDAPDESKLRSVASAISGHIVTLRTQMREDANTDGLDLLAQIETRLGDLVEARSVEFAQDIQVQETLEQAQSAAITVAQTVEKEGDLAYQALLAGGDATATAVSDSLGRFINQDVAGIQNALAARIEVNVLLGVAMGLSSNSDYAQIPILTGIATASINRLAKVTEALSTGEETGALAGQLADLSRRMSDVISNPRVIAAQAKALVSDLQAVDHDLVGVQDNLRFNLEMASVETSDTNQGAIKQLVEQDAAPLRSLGRLDAAARSVFAAAVEVLAVRDPDILPQAAEKLAKRADELAAAFAQTQSQIGPQIQQLIGLADANSGIAAQQRGKLMAHEQAKQASDMAGKVVGQMSENLRDDSAAALAAVADTSRKTREDSRNAAASMWRLALVAASVLAFAPIMAWVFVIAPIRRATRATTRLAAGDLAAADGLRAGGGEVGQLARTLLVFRDTLRQNLAMQAEEQRKQAQEAAQTLAAQRAELERAAQETARQAEAELRDRQRQDAEAAERQRLRAAADAERQAMLDVQNQVVTALASGLHCLSQGNLTAAIDQEFGGGYDGLREDFNAALATLRDLVAEIRATAQEINSQSASVSQSAEELSRRTESNAATLEQSSAALSELTKLVKSTARQSVEARSIAAEANTRSDQGRDAVQRAKTAMEAIADSSTQIAKIVEMIQGIAFQTNLLALNAGVEAARAGESGRGFAVVAQEVRALSLRTTEAAQEISGLIAKSADDVTRGVEIVADVDTALGHIDVAILSLNGTIAEISAATAEQSSGLSEIDSAVGQLDQNTQGNAAISANVTATGHSLLAQVGHLSQKLAHFSIDPPRARFARSA